MHDTAVSDVDTDVPRVTNQVSRLRRIQRDFLADHGKRPGGSGDANAEFLIDSPDKTGAVRPVGQGSAARYIGASDKLRGKVGDVRSACTARRRIGLFLFLRAIFFASPIAFLARIPFLSLSLFRFLLRPGFCLRFCLLLRFLR